jgi:hypothetical protein
MKAQEAKIESATHVEDIHRATSLVEAMGITSPDCSSKLQAHGLTARRPVLPFLFDFLVREPFGFAFTEGQEAKFRVPSGHRFVIEHADICCWAKDDHLDVEFVTTSSRTYCSRTSDRSLLQASPCEDCAAPASEPIWVQGSSVTTFLFSNHEVRGSSIVPPDTYVQVWGYLEPTNVTVGF